MTPELNPPPLTLFTWGYEGWGNAVPDLLAATERVERKRGFAPPVFVDVRFRRAGRAVGFREKAFEQALGPDRYHWMKSLGNANIGTSNGHIARIAQPEAVNDLIDLALQAQAQNRRVIFFCACGPLRSDCHRHEVARLTLDAAERRAIPLTVVAWPGGEPGTQVAATIEAPRTLIKATDAETYKGGLIPIDEAHVGEAVGWPWGTQVLAKLDTDQLLLAVGPAMPRAGKWLVQVMAWHGVEGPAVNAELNAWAMETRDEYNLAPRTSTIPKPVTPPAETPLVPAPPASPANIPSHVQIFHSKSDPGAHAGFQLWRRANPDGYYLSMDTSKSGRLHRVTCLHLADITWEPEDFGCDLAKHRKICATTLKTLQTWAAQQGITTRYCRTCDLP